MPTDPVVVHLGLGSNRGDRQRHLDFALDRLRSVPGVEILACSRVRETAPVGGPPQGPFLNAVVEVRCMLAPHALLAVRFGPRELDIDILLFGSERIDTRDLIVPHPRLCEREFVLEPLRELGVDVRRIPQEPRPRVVRDPAAFATLCAQWRAGGCRIGLVPTMGALHAGHASLMRRARAGCDRVAATVFVNPLQFAPHEDLSRYPRPFEADVALCAREDVDAVFAPSVEAMYPPGFVSRIAVGREALGMEGAARPDHFSGVATVVTRLWSLALPHVGYFGEKDAQQLAVLRRVHADLGLCGAIEGCAIVREPDGLAMSSRNVYLAPDDRRAGRVLSRALRAADRAFRDGERDRDRLLARAREVLAGEPRCRVDYLELRSADDLAELPSGTVGPVRLLVAGRFGDPVTRLLDNAVLGRDDLPEPAA